MGEWSSTLAVKPMRWSPNHPLRPAGGNHPLWDKDGNEDISLKTTMVRTNFSTFIVFVYLCNRSHLCDKWPPCKRDSRGHLCNCTSSLQFSGDRAFVCVEQLPPPLRPFLCNFDAQPSFVWGTYLWASCPARTIVVYWLLPAKCFSPSARTTCPILLITVQSAFLTHDSAPANPLCLYVVCLLLVEHISSASMYKRCHLWDTTSYYTSFAHLLQTCCM